ncbi:TonB-dependent siderophore receptor [uncultured Chitinophaga sp.]|jgi:TonB-dependent siderophore receptor|uniref:TonB-dependent siderophore receptor n=1 Tax=uncultured Chitinophaga sp. TaxID=339340 RepID=UPI00263384F6|nr:TonB-dependent siderophore receptor [uncultured Chitinophaga sp.]
MFKCLILLVLLICTLGTASAQQANDNTGTIKGTITTAEGSPAAAVTVKVKNTRWGAVSDEQGQYTITNVKPGDWLLAVSNLSALETKRITVSAGKTTRADFVLTETAAQLKEITIISRNVNREDKYVAKMPLRNLENPQVYNTVSAELLKQQVISNYDDAFRNVPGITRTWESTGRAGDGGAYFALRGFDAQPLLVNGLPGITSGNLDPANIEQIEVIKGPSGTLFGGSFYSYGGMINTITKKPYYTFGGEIAYNTGSWDLHRVTLDINSPLSKTKKVALRLNGAVHTENTFQDAGFKKSYFVAPSFSWEVNDRLSFSVMAEVLQEKRAVPPVFFHSDRVSPLDFRTVEELGLNNRKSFTSNDLTIKNPRTNVQAQMLYKLASNWTSQTVVSTGRVKADGIYTYIWDDVPGDKWFQQYFHYEHQTTTTLDIQQNFNGDFKIGNMRNRLLVGLDYFHRHVVEASSAWATGGRNVTAPGEIGYFDPATGEPAPLFDLTMEAIKNLVTPLDETKSDISNSTYAAYASNVLNITPALNVMLSLRADYFDSKGDKDTDEDDYNQFALSPKFGVVYQPILNKLSVFGSYMNAFINVAPQQVSDPDENFTYVKSFEPEHANQFEFGAKGVLLGEKLTGTISVYEIKVSNRVMPDPANPLNVIQGGKVRSRGVELDLNAAPVQGLNIIAGYSFNRIKNLAGDKNDFYGEPGRNPGGQGPQHLVNLWATYRFEQGALKNFGIGLGGNYGSTYKVIDNSQTGVFLLPAYTLLNGSVCYNARKFRVSFALNNITDEVWYTGYWSINPQRPRNFAASVAYKF